MTCILAVDPGDSTGLAWLDNQRNLHTTVAPDHEKVYQVIQTLRPAVLIVEWFITGQRLNQYSRRTIELCGACSALAWMIGAKLVKHTPKTRYPMMDEAERILTAQRGPRGTTRKGAGVWTDHENDALAHLCVHLHRMGQTFIAPMKITSPSARETTAALSK